MTASTTTNVTSPWSSTWTPRSAGVIRQQLDALRPDSPLAMIADNLLENYYRDEERELSNDIAAGFLSSRGQSK